MTIADNVKTILKEAGNARLVCVTKTVDPTQINEAITAGATIIGENRVQEFEKKCEYILDCERHLIGHLQSNKVKKAVNMFDVIQSVDSLKLIQSINKKAGDIGKVQNIFLQINISNEIQKYGFKAEEIQFIIEQAHLYDHVCVRGLMCIPPFVAANKNRVHFYNMKTLFDKLKTENVGNIELKDLSMGMSNDYTIALKEGATMIRVGSAIFGERLN